MKTIKAESYWVKGSKKGYIKSHVISPPSENELLIKTLYSGISFGTEKIVFTETSLQARESLCDALIKRDPLVEMSNMDI